VFIKLLILTFALSFVICTQEIENRLIAVFYLTTDQENVIYKMQNWWLIKPRNKFFVFVIAISLTSAYFLLALDYFISSCSSFILLALFLLFLVYQFFSSKQEGLCLNSCSRGIERRSSGALHWEFDFTSYFELTILDVNLYYCISHLD